MSAGSDMVRLDRVGDALVVKLERPEVHNALHPAQLRELLNVIESQGERDDLKLIVLTGAGTKAFSSGFDIKALQEAGPGGPPPSTAVFELTAALSACEITTIAAIRGHCIGAGLDLALSCDHRIATPDSHFALPAAKLGTVYEPRSLERIAALLGAGVVKRLAVCGHDLDATQALRVGLVDELVEPGDLLATAIGWVEPGPAAARAHKRIIDAVAGPPAHDESFWEPLDRLREHSVASRDRMDAIDEFVDGKGANVDPR